MSLVTSAPDRRGLFLAAALLGAGALLRLAALSHPPPVNIDEVRYLLTAHHVAVGLGYSDWRGPETHIHPALPVLTATLAGARRESLEGYGRSVNTVASILLLVPLGMLAFRLGGMPTALLSLALLAFHPALARAAATVGPEGLYVLATGLAIWLLLPIVEAPLPLWRWGVAGICFGGAYLARPEGLPVGMLAGVVAAVLGRGTGRHLAWAGLGLFLLTLLATASPFLLFIHRTTGEWSLTGKTLELFFIGQGLLETGGQPPDYLRLRELQHQWQGVLPFLRANPQSVLGAAALSARGIFLRLLPSQLGPVGLLGLLGFLLALFRHRPLLRQSLLYFAPCLTLLLMLLTFPNARVVGSVVPFLLILSAFGWTFWMIALIPGRRARIGLAVVVLVASGVMAWARTLRHLPENPFGRAVSPERSAARQALERAGNPARIACNDPVLSYYAGEPALFGPPGAYRALPGEASCNQLVSILKERHASVAILSGAKAGIDLAVSSKDCSLQSIFESRRPTGEPLRVYALEDGAEREQP